MKNILKEHILKTIHLSENQMEKACAFLKLRRLEKKN